MMSTRSSPLETSRAAENRPSPDLTDSPGDLNKSPESWVHLNAVAVLVEALDFIVIGRSCSEGCRFDSHYRPSGFLRFNSRPIMSSPYCATSNKGVRLLSVLELWPIVETLVMSENDGTTVRQTVAHTIQLWPNGLGTPCCSRLSKRKAHE